MKCIVRTSKEFLKLVEETNLSPIMLDMRIGKWQEVNNSDEFPSAEEILNYTKSTPEVNMVMKSVTILQSSKGDEVFRKGDKNNWTIDKMLQELQVPKEQQELIKSFNTRNREEILTSLLANYSYTVEVNTAKERIEKNDIIDREFEVIYGYKKGSFEEFIRDKFRGEDKEFIKTQIEKNTQSLYWNEYQEKQELVNDTNTSHYSDLTVPGGTAYTENEISTPLITPSIKGHAQFSTDNGIGWFRSDEQVDREGVYDELGFSSDLETSSGSKTRRILEVQSDLFQKGRDLDNLISGKELQDNYNAQYDGNIETFYDADNNRYFKVENGKETTISEKEFNSINSPKESSKNQFLQLLNKDNNWVTFFIKSIIQDTAKQTITEVQQEDVEAKVRELEKDGLLKIDCKGKLKAEGGIATLFEKGGKWEIITDFKNAPTHKSGGKDISIQGKKVEVEKNELRIENDFGDIAIIPSKYKVKVKDAIKSNCHSCIDGMVESLPKMKDYAGDGTVFPFFGRYKRFKNSLPDNLKNTSEDEYAMRYYWKHNNKPKSFDEAIKKEQPMFTMEDDGYYHAPSVESNTLRFLKPKNHPTLQYELDWYNSDNPDAVDFRNKYDLDTSDRFYKYVPKKLGQ